MKLLSKLFNLNDLKRGTWLIKLSAYVSIMSSTALLVILAIVGAFVFNNGLSITMAILGAIILISVILLISLWIYARKEKRVKTVKWKEKQ